MPAKYGDLSKKGDDLFKKGFEHEHHKLEICSKSDGFEFTTKGALKGGAISSSHEMKMNKLCPLGGKLKATFTPGNDSMACEYEYTKVAKLTACFSVPMNGMPVPAPKELKANWSNEKAHLNVSSNLGDKVNIDATVDLKHCLFGAKLGLDAKSFGLNSKELALHHANGNMNCTVKSSLNNDFNAVCHNQISPSFALATSCTYNSKGTSLAVAGQQKACCGTTNSFKLANNGRFAISHCTPYNNSSKLTISGEFDATNMAAGNHKIGAGLKFDL
jgi:hypothetical protein